MGGVRACVGDSALALTAIRFLAFTVEGATFAATMTDGSPLGDCLFVLNSAEGFLGHPRGGMGYPGSLRCFGDPSTPAS